MKRDSLILPTILGLTFFLNACSKDEKSIHFPITEYLSVSEVRSTESVFFRYSFRIRLNDSLLYIADLHATDYYCHQFEYPSMKHRQSFARKGNGSGEFMDAENIRIDSNGDCWLLDANNAKMVCFQSSPSDSLVTEFKLDSCLVRTLDFDLYQDSLFIVPDYTGEYRFHILCSDGVIKESRGSIPVRKRDADIPNAAYAQAWRSFFDYNSENGIMAIATQLGEVIEIYQVEKDSLINVICGNMGEPQFEYKRGYAVPIGIMGYSDVYVGKENIYALFWGHTFKDIAREIVTVEGGNQIQVFDMEGNPVKQYMLDRYITGFVIDEKNEIILGLDVNSDQPVIELKVK